MKKGIKVKELASQLGITSRQLIDRCRAEGLFVQNSISKLTPQQEQLVRGFYTPRPDDASALGASPD